MWGKIYISIRKHLADFTTDVADGDRSMMPQMLASYYLAILATLANQWQTNSFSKQLKYQNRMSIEHVILISSHDDVIKWKDFLRHWPFVRGIQRSPVNSPRKGQWRGALMFSLICACINGWINNRKAGDLRRHRAHYDVIVMIVTICWKYILYSPCEPSFGIPDRILTSTRRQAIIWTNGS